MRRDTLPQPHSRVAPRFTVRALRRQADDSITCVNERGEIIDLVGWLFLLDEGGTTSLNRAVAPVKNM